MKRERASEMLCLSLLALSGGCVAVLGDNRTPGDPQAAATVQGGVDDERGPIRFDVAAERVVSATWRYDFACTGPCGGWADVRVAPDGSIWAALLGGYTSVPRTPGAMPDNRLRFIHLDKYGSEQNSYAKSIVTNGFGGGSPLLLDQDGQPYVLRWPTITNDPNLGARALRLRDEQIEDQPLPAGFHQGDTEYIAGFPDGSFLEFSSDNAVKAARFSARGEKIWEANDLRALPMQDGSSAVTGPIYLSDGAVVFDGLHKPDPIDAEGGLGLTVLGPDGQVRWDMRYYFSFGPPFKQLAAGVDGELILAGMGSPDQDLGIYVYDRRGALLRSYRGVRVGYHPVGPRALAVDENGAIYVALVVGERDDPRLAVCKLSREVEVHGAALKQDGETPVRCLELDVVSLDRRSENATPLPFLMLRMEVAEPDAVLLTLPRAVGEDMRLGVLRVDLTPEAGTPAQ